MVIGAGVAGMKASLLLAGAGWKVHLVESSSVIGGRTIQWEDIYPGFECATCMVSPMQQEVLRHELIRVSLLSEVLSIEEVENGFRARIRSRASSVDPEACIGCAECSSACPEETDNGFEEDLVPRKAISVPCAGALPNVPWLDRDTCSRFTQGSQCSLCRDACMFEAIDFTSSDLEFQIDAAAVILATGYDTEPLESFLSPESISNPGVFSAAQFERYYASNGPTSGSLTTKAGKVPSSIAIMPHAGGTGEWSGLNTMYSLKFLHYMEEKLPDCEPVLLLDDSYRPHPSNDRFHSALENAKAGRLLYRTEPEILCGEDGEIKIGLKTEEGEMNLQTDMLILCTPIRPSSGTALMTEMLDLETDDLGFILSPDSRSSAVTTSRPGIFAAGSAMGPMGISRSVVRSSAAAARVLSMRKDGEE